MSAGETETDAPDLTDVDEVWLGDQAVAGDEFVAALDLVAEFQRVLREFKKDLDDMSVGLDRDDAVNLIYARNYDLSKSQVEAGFAVIDAFVEEDLEDAAPRIIADKSSDLTIAEAAEVWEDMVRLAEKYGRETDADTSDDT